MYYFFNLITPIHIYMQVWLNKVRPSSLNNINNDKRVQYKNIMIFVIAIKTRHLSEKINTNILKT